MTVEFPAPVLDAQKRALGAAPVMPDPEPCPKHETLQRRVKEWDEPFFPYPLKSKIAHVDGEPFRKTTKYIYVQAICTVGVKLANRLSHCGTNGLRRQLAKFGNQSRVIDGLGGAFRQEELRTKDCLNSDQQNEM
jgi:hypothetical protein